MIVLYLLPVCIHTVFHVTFFVTVLILLKILPNTVSPIRCSRFSLCLSGTTVPIDIETWDAQWEACSDVQHVSFRRAKAGSFSILFPFSFWLQFYFCLWSTYLPRCSLPRSWRFLFQLLGPRGVYSIGLDHWICVMNMDMDMDMDWKWDHWLAMAISLQHLCKTRYLPTLGYLACICRASLLCW